jgi:hypothetical protein
VKALIETHLFKQIASDRSRESSRRAAQAAADALVIRTASAGDRGRLERLAVLDCAQVPDGPVLVAEREGMLVAALPLGSGRAIADPFERSADAVSLLELRRTQLRPAL